MCAETVVASFAFTCQTPQMPPSWAWVEAQVSAFLPPESRILGWAIVKTDLNSRQLWVEGSYLGAPIPIEFATI